MNPGTWTADATSVCSSASALAAMIMLPENRKRKAVRDMRRGYSASYPGPTASPSEAFKTKLKKDWYSRA